VFLKLLHLQLKLCHSKLGAAFGFSKCAYNYYSDRKSSQTNPFQKWGRVSLDEVTTPFRVQT